MTNEDYKRIVNAMGRVIPEDRGAIVMISQKSGLMVISTAGSDEEKVRMAKALKVFFEPLKK